MEHIQLRLFNAFKRSGFNEDDAMDIASIVEKVSDVSDIRKDVSDIKVRVAIIETKLDNMQKINWIIVAGIISLLIKEFLFRSA